MELLVEIAADGLLCVGCLFVLIGALGIVRLPDFFTRMHAAGMIDTMGAYLVVSGIALRVGWDLALVKLASILFLFAITGSTAAHALARAALATSLVPRDENGEDLPSNP